MRTNAYNPPSIDTSQLDESILNLELQAAASLVAMSRGGSSLELPTYQEDFGSLSFAHTGFGHPSMAFDNMFSWTPDRERFNVTDPAQWNTSGTLDEDSSTSSDINRTCTEGAAAALSDNHDEEFEPSEHCFTISMSSSAIEMMKKEFNHLFEIGLPLNEFKVKGLQAEGDFSKPEEDAWLLESLKVPLLTEEPKDPLLKNFPEELRNEEKDKPDQSKQLPQVPSILQQSPDAEIAKPMKKRSREIPIRREIPALIPIDPFYDQSQPMVIISKIIHLNDNGAMNHCCIHCNNVFPLMEVPSGKITAPRHWIKWAMPSLQPPRDRVSSRTPEAFIIPAEVTGKRALSASPQKVSIPEKKEESRKKETKGTAPDGSKSGKKTKARNSRGNRRRKKLKTTR